MARQAGNEKVLADFEQYAASSCACKGMPRWELDRLVSLESAVAATYNQQITGRSRVPDDNRWDLLRRIASAAFFQSYGDEIHFAALSTEGRWLTSYGDGAVFFKESMIGHRASLFETNTAVWVDENNGALNIPPGRMAVWGQRGLLAVAKLGAEACNSPCDKGVLLLSCGASSADDSFIEVHILGDFTIRSTNALVVRSSAISELSRAAITARAAQLGFVFTELP